MLTKEIIEKKYPGKKLEKIKYLDLWVKDLENVDIISQMKSLKIINFSGNKISSLKPFGKLEHLKELYIRNNNISNIEEINYHKDNENLKSLWMSKNPVSKNEKEFRKAIAEKVPNLSTLDNTPISEIKKNLDNIKDGEIIDNTDNNGNKVDNDKKDEDFQKNKVAEENIEKTEEDQIFADLIGDVYKKEEVKNPKKNE